MGLVINKDMKEEPNCEFNNCNNPSTGIVVYKGMIYSLCKRCAKQLKMQKKADNNY